MIKDFNYRIILGSKSPRRQQLLKELGFDFDVHTKDTDEDYPEELKREEIPLYLCRKKASAFEKDLMDGQLLLTADTIVWLDNQALNKPVNYDDAVRMLQMLSGRMHEVITAVCLKSTDKTHSFHSITDVYFKDLSEEEIEYYVKNYKPYDKAGAYGVQEWIGYVGIERLKGSYFNVVGLPTKELYEELSKFGK